MNAIDKAIKETTRQVEAEENLQKLREISDRLIEPELAIQIVENAQRAIIIARRDGTIFYINKLAEIIFEYPRVELWDKSLETIIPDRLQEDHRTMFERYILAPRARDFTDALHTIGRKKSGVELNYCVIARCHFGRVLYRRIDRTESIKMKCQKSIST